VERLFEVLALAGALAVAACGPAATGAQQPGGAPPNPWQPTSRRTATPAPLDPLAQAQVGRVSSTRFGVSIPLPDPDGWKLVRERSSFLLLDHPASSSQLVVRLWRESETMNRDRCEEQARALRDLPPHDPAGGLSRRRVDVPPEFDTLVEVGLSRAHPAEPLTGYVMAFGGWVRRCFAFVYTTQSSAPDAERAVGDRLAVMEARALEGLELRSDTSLEGTDLRGSTGR
jgi:hypothetical protein